MFKNNKDDSNAELMDICYVILSTIVLAVVLIPEYRDMITYAIEKAGFVYIFLKEILGIGN